MRTGGLEEGRRPTMSSSYLEIRMSSHWPGRFVAAKVFAFGGTWRSCPGYVASLFRGVPEVKSGVHAMHLDTDIRGGSGERYTGGGTGMQSIPQSGAALLSRRLEAFR
jgi:hypothetical protein